MPTTTRTSKLSETALSTDISSTDRADSKAPTKAIVTIGGGSGLSVLLISDFVPTRRFSELTSLTIIGALLGDLVLLPAMLLLFAGKPARASKT